MIRVIALIAFLFSPLSLADIAVVVSEDNDSSLSKEDVEQLFLGENMFFPDGEPATVVTQRSRNSEYTRFNTAFLGMSNTAFKSHWSRVIFAGRGQPPKETSGLNDLLSKIRQDKSIIAYVDAGSVPKGLRVILTVEE
ncbi:MAG: hypothetical protein GY774_11400 [Planctomycetes bacterium]|nr:hypothetical protein [Planctomycetota bacterium]